MGSLMTPNRCRLRSQARGPCTRAVAEDGGTQERVTIALHRALNNNQVTRKGHRKPSGKGARFFLHQGNHPTPQVPRLRPPYSPRQDAEPGRSFLGRLFMACSWSVEGLSSCAL